MSQTKSSEEQQEFVETRWTDAQIRWSDPPKKQTDKDDDDSCENPFDPFKQASDVQEQYTFQFPHPSGKVIHIDLQGFKGDSDQAWESTGLTLWRAAEYLCHYLAKHGDLLQNKRILEVCIAFLRRVLILINLWFLTLKMIHSFIHSFSWVPVWAFVGFWRIA